jgi:hypothetical protein
MNKNLKFRAWDGKRFHEWGYIDKGFGVVFVSPPAPHYVSQQFTTKVDKMGKEIYKGDVVILKGSKFIFEVIFEDSSYAIRCTKHSQHGLLFIDINFAEVEVIGNIFETPEFIEEKK